MAGKAPIAAVILAAGKGTRMKSALPKVLHEIGGRSMLGHVMQTVSALGVDKTVVVVGPDMNQVAEAASGADIAIQHEALGTGHAVQAAEQAIGNIDGTVFVLFADTPLVRQETFEAMREIREGGAGVVVLGFSPDDPAAYGRLITDPSGDLEAIVEFKDANEAQRAVRLCNAGLMAIDGTVLFDLLSKVTNDNAKGEYYLTDIVALARAQGIACRVTEADADEVLGVNSRVQLAEAEAEFQARCRQAAMENGVTLQAPETVYFSADTRLGSDVIVEPNVVFGPGVSVADGVTIKAFTHLEGAHVGASSAIGPFARLRPGTELGAKTKVGNFVEIKNAVVEDGAKINHLSYVGDAFVGARSNIGAGTITCNYDGFNKYLTVIEEDVFIGSNTALVAPVRLGKGANTGAGSVISQDLDADALGVTRAPQRQLDGGAAKYRSKKSAEKAAGKWGKPDPASVKKSDD